MLGENPSLGEPDVIFFSLSSHKEKRVGERMAFALGTPLSGSLPARASRGESEPGIDRQFVISLISITYRNEGRPGAGNESECSTS
jgi:hypothetical protein